MSTQTITPDVSGYYGEYGGMFIPEILLTTFDELISVFTEAKADPEFWQSYVDVMQNYSCRPTPITQLGNFANSLGGKFQIFCKREDLNHTGAHKANNVMGQGLLVQRMGKKRVIAETGAGQHGVATATMAAKMGLGCTIYMGSLDVKRQRPNVFWMEQLGANVVSVTEGTSTLKDAINAAMRDWAETLETTHYVLGTTCGPHPFPEMVAWFQSIIGQESREQMLKLTGKLPDRIYACVGGGSNASGIFLPFLEDKSVELVGVEAGGHGLNTGAHAARFSGGSVGIAQGYKTYFFQDNEGQMRLKQFVPLCFCALVLLSGCGAPTLSKFEVQRPSRITVPSMVKKVFIRSDLVADTNDLLGIKSQVLQQLSTELNRLGRFKVSVVDTFSESQIDLEKDTVAIVQGEVTSGGEVDRGQFTDIATCTGGIGGRLFSAGAAAISDEAITLDNWRGYVCRKGAFGSDVTELALSSAFAMAGLSEVIPPKNQVVRTYNYKNISLFAQANFSFTTIGLSRETLAIRADSASFGRSITEKDSYRNIKESHLISLTLGSLISITRIPIAPIPIREVALAGRSNPKQTYYGQKRLPVPGINDLPAKEKRRVIVQLVNQTLMSFIRTISPYKVLVGAEAASGGKAGAENLLNAGKAKKARSKIEAIPEDERDPEDWYNLGLAYEASAVSREDYEDARRFYITALEKSPGIKLYAQGVGRTRRYLSETRTLAKQTQE